MSSKIMHQTCISRYNPNGFILLLIFTNIKSYNDIEFTHNENYAYITYIDKETNMFFNEINYNCLKFVCSSFHKKPFELKIIHYTEQRLQNSSQPML